MWVIIPIILSLAFLLSLYYYDVWPSKTIVRKNLPGFIFVYKEYQGDFNQMHDFFKEFMGDLSEAAIREEDVIQCCVSFDNPNKIKDKSKMRFAIGVHCNEHDSVLIFERLNPFGYRRIRLPTAPALFTLYSYRNRLSFLLLSLFWSRISAKCKQMKKVEHTVGVEIYDLHVNKQIFLNLVYGVEAVHYQFSSLEND